MIRAAFALILLAFLSGCAGTATYSVKPFYEPNTKAMVCCEAIAINGKDIQALTFDLSTTPGGAVVVHFQETGVGATAPDTAQGAVVSNVATALGNAAAEAIKITP